MKKIDSRYPYTYAADFIRAIIGCDSEGAILSRCQASQLRTEIADAIGMDDEELAKKLADAELAKTDEEINEQAIRTLKEIGVLA